MGERKVLSKYYPPDFDPSKVPRLRKPKDKDSAVRFMLPMSVQCTTCGAFMGRGLKFNARKSNTDEDYLGIRIYRFTMRCKECPAQFAIKTDPKNSDYICESGVKRNFEPWRDKQQKEGEAKAERERTDQDTMVALENKTADAKKEMEELDELDVLKSARSVQSAIYPDDILAGKRRAAEIEKLRCEQEEEDLIAEEAAKAFAQKRARLATEQPSLQAQPAVLQSDKAATSRKPKKLPFAMKLIRKKVPAANGTAAVASDTRSKTDGKASEPAMKKRETEPGEKPDAQQSKDNNPMGGMLDYSSSESESD